MNKHPTISMHKTDKSGQIESIGHDLATNTLAVTFRHGGTYHYHGVNAGQFDELKKAESVGKHLHAHIKSAHKFTKLETK